jgi:hypothetical protein
VEREESDLYGLPLDEFIPARTELERRLRKEGDRARAAAVKKLPKPTVAAWAVNQASRSQPQDRRALIETSAALRRAQERLIAGDGSATELERAAAAQRAAVDTLLDAAGGLLTSDGKGLGETILARVRETLAAVAADGELADLVESGTLDSERRSAGLGFGMLGGAEPADAASPVPADPSTKPRRKGSNEGARAKPRGKDDKDAKRAAKAAKQRERELRAARERVKAAKASEKAATRARKAAERAANEAADELERAESAAAEASSAREAAEAELERLD